MPMNHYLMLHFKVSQSQNSPRNQNAPLRDKFRLICYSIGQFQIIVWIYWHCKYASALAIYHDCFVLSIVIFNYALNAAYFSIVTMTVPLTMSHYWLAQRFNFKRHSFQWNFIRKCAVYVALIKDSFLFSPPKKFEYQLVTSVII